MNLFNSYFEFFLFLFISNKYLILYHPEQYNKALIAVSYNFIYYFSFAQINFTKLALILNNKCWEFINSNPQLLEYVNKLKKQENTVNNIEYILNNSVICSNTYDETVHLHLSQPYKLPQDFDFIIYCHNIKNNGTINKLILNELPKNEIYNNLKYEETIYNFLLCELIVGDKIIKIDFKTSDYNFMIVNNKINAKFINYFMKKHYSICEDIVSYQLKILDQNVSKVLLDETKELHLFLDCYLVNEIEENIVNEIEVNE
jgi:hypothetical protein